MHDKGPFVAEYLGTLKQTIDLALAQYPKVLAFRADLTFPQTVDLNHYFHNNQVLSRFLESFKAKVEHNRAQARRVDPYAYDSKVRYVWAREFGQQGNPHYHLLFLLNQDAFYTVGRLVSSNPNMISRMQEAWASALAVPLEMASSRVHISDEATYRLQRGDLSEYSRLFRRASYLCKSSTKFFEDGSHGFGSSRG
jgi:glycosyltransferase involved in cell wall biosynthesis